MNKISKCLQQSGAEEACWAHNPEVDGSKPSAATLFFFFSFFLFKDFCAHSIPYCHVPLIAQLVERRTVVGCAEILRSLVRIRLEGQLFLFNALCPLSEQQKNCAPGEARTHDLQITLALDSL